MNKPVAFAAAAALSTALLAGCGNKGPLVRPSDVPPPQAMPAMAPAADDATLPDLTPPVQPPVTDAVAPAPANGTTGSDAATPPPPPGDGD